MAEKPRIAGTVTSIKLTEAQRKVVAELVPDFAERLKLDEQNQRTIAVSLEELAKIHRKAQRAIQHPKSGMRQSSLWHVIDIATKAIEKAQGIGAIPASQRLYQFKITMNETRPPIWRRIQVKDCTLDKLHEHIQTAMGWTNSHLHHFRINDQLYGDPMLMQENFDEMGYEDSTNTKLSDILPKSGKRFRFEYEYDFGDSWEHQVLFEGCLRAGKGIRYPLCLEGERACPPEDVGGVGGFAGYLEAVTDPEHEQHDEWLGWSGPFDPDSFDAAEATKMMRRGLPDWRNL